MILQVDLTLVLNVYLYDIYIYMCVCVCVAQSAWYATISKHVWNDKEVQSLHSNKCRHQWVAGIAIIIDYNV